MNLFCATDNVGVYPDVTYYWRVRSNNKNKSITQKYGEITNIKDRLLIIKLIYDLLSSSNKYNELINAYNKKLIEIDYRYIINQLSSKKWRNHWFILLRKLNLFLRNMDDDLFKIKYDLLINGKIENLIQFRRYELDNQKLTSEKMY